MLDWFSQNFFPMDLQIQCSLQANVFRTLEELFRLLKGEVPFAVPAAKLAAARAPPVDDVRVGSARRPVTFCGAPMLEPI